MEVVPTWPNLAAHRWIWPWSPGRRAGMSCLPVAAARPWPRRPGLARCAPPLPVPAVCPPLVDGCSSTPAWLRARSWPVADGCAGRWRKWKMVLGGRAARGAPWKRRQRRDETMGSRSFFEDRGRFWRVLELPMICEVFCFLHSSQTPNLAKIIPKFLEML